MYLCTSHDQSFIPYLNKEPGAEGYGLSLRMKEGKLQIGGPNYYGRGGT